MGWGVSPSGQKKLEKLIIALSSQLPTEDDQYWGAPYAFLSSSLFYGDTPNDAQWLLLALQSGITRGRLREPCGIVGIEPRLVCVQGKYPFCCTVALILPLMLFLPPVSSEYDGGHRGQQGLSPSPNPTVCVLEVLVCLCWGRGGSYFE